MDHQHHVYQALGASSLRPDFPETFFSLCCLQHRASFSALLGCLYPHGLSHLSTSCLELGQKSSRSLRQYYQSRNRVRGYQYDPRPRDCIPANANLVNPSDAIEFKNRAQRRLQSWTVVSELICSHEDHRYGYLSPARLEQPVAVLCSWTE